MSLVVFYQNMENKNGGNTSFFLTPPFYKQAPSKSTMMRDDLTARFLVFLETKFKIHRDLLGPFGKET